MASFEINKVLLMGNLTQDPETRYLPSGTAVAKMRLAANRRYRDKSGEQREETLFINVEAWGRTAELCQEYLQKGSEVLVEGRLKMDSYQGQDGQNRTFYGISADRVQFGRRPGQGGPGQGTYGEESADAGGGEYNPPSNRASSAPGSYGNSGYSQRNASGGGGFGQRQAAPPRQSSPPTWQSDSSSRDFPEESVPPADDFGDESGGTNNDLPF